MSDFLLVLQRMNIIKYNFIQINLLIENKLIICALENLHYNFIMLENEMESYVRIGRRGLKNLTYPYMGLEVGSKFLNSFLRN